MRRAQPNAKSPFTIACLCHYCHKQRQTTLSASIHPFVWKFVGSLKGQFDLDTPAPVWPSPKAQCRRGDDMHLLLQIPKPLCAIAHSRLHLCTFHCLLRFHLTQATLCIALSSCACAAKGSSSRDMLRAHKLSTNNTAEVLRREARYRAHLLSKNNIFEHNFSKKSNDAMVIA